MWPTETDTELYRKHADELVRYATMLVGPDDAPDVVANAVLSCMTSRRWPEVINRRAYLFRATLHEARRLGRALIRRREAEQRAGQHGSGRFAMIGEPDLRFALDRLSVRQRSTIYLTYWEDLTPPEVAQLLGISEGAVRRHLARARSHLREVLDER